MIKKGYFWKGKPFLYHDKKLYIGEPDQFHYDLIEKTANSVYGDLMGLWMHGEAYTGRIWENDGKLRTYDVDGSERLTKTTLNEIDRVIKKHYGADESEDPKAKRGISFTGAVVLQGLPPASGRALRPDKHRRDEIEPLMNEPYIVVAQIVDVDYAWLTGNAGSNDMPDTCMGIVSEKGGTQSHGAIVARENNRACVVDASGVKKVKQGDEITIYTEKTEDKKLGQVDVNGGGAPQKGGQIGHPHSTFAYSNGNSIINSDLDENAKKRYLEKFGLWSDEHATTGRIHKGGYAHYDNADLPEHFVNDLTDHIQRKHYDTHTVSADEPLYEKKGKEEIARFVWFRGKLNDRRVDPDDPFNENAMHKAIKEDLQKEDPTISPFDFMTDATEGVIYSNGTADAYTGDDADRIPELETAIKKAYPEVKKINWGGTYGGEVSNESVPAKEISWGDENAPSVQGIDWGAAPANVPETPADTPQMIDWGATSSYRNGQVSQQRTEESETLAPFSLYSTPHEAASNEPGEHKCPHCNSHSYRIIDGHEQTCHCLNCGKEFKDKDIIEHPNKKSSEEVYLDDRFILSYRSDGSCSNCGSHSVKEDSQCMQCGYINGNNPPMPVPNTEEKGTGWDDWPSFNPLASKGNQGGGLLLPGDKGETPLPAASISGGFSKENVKTPPSDFGTPKEAADKWERLQQNPYSETSCPLCGMYNLVDDGFGDPKCTNCGWDEWDERKHYPDDWDYPGFQSTRASIGADWERRNGSHQKEAFTPEMPGHPWNEQVYGPARYNDTPFSMPWKGRTCPECGEDMDENIEDWSCPNCGAVVEKVDTHEASDQSHGPYHVRQRSNDDPQYEGVKKIGPNECPTCGADAVRISPNQMRCRNGHIFAKPFSKSAFSQWRCPNCGHWDYEYPNQGGRGIGWHDCENCGWKEGPQPQDVETREAATTTFADPDDEPWDYEGIMHGEPEPWDRDTLEEMYNASPACPQCGTQMVPDDEGIVDYECPDCGYIHKEGSVIKEKEAATSKDVVITHGNQKCPNCGAKGAGHWEKYVSAKGNNKVKCKNCGMNFHTSLDKLGPGVGEHINQPKVTPIPGAPKNYTVHPPDEGEDEEQDCPQCGQSGYNPDWGDCQYCGYSPYKEECPNCGYQSYDSDSGYGGGYCENCGYEGNSTEDYGGHSLDKDVPTIQEQEASGKSHWSGRFGFIVDGQGQGHLAMNDDDHYPVIDKFRDELFGGDWIKLSNALQAWGTISRSPQSVSIYLTTDVGRIDDAAVEPLRKFVSQQTGLPEDKINIEGDSSHTNTSEYGYSTFLGWEDPSKPAGLGINQVTAPQPPEQGQMIDWGAMSAPAEEPKTSKTAKVSDTNGKPLQPGRTYLMRSVKYKVPDIVMLKSIHPDHLEAVIAGDNKGYFPITITTEDYDKYKYTFEPKVGSAEEEEKVRAWRLERLYEKGVPFDVANEIAEDFHTPYQDIVDAIDKGADPATAAEIYRPIKQADVEHPEGGYVFCNNCGSEDVDHIDDDPYYGSIYHCNSCGYEGTDFGAPYDWKEAAAPYDFETGEGGDMDEENPDCPWCGAITYANDMGRLACPRCGWDEDIDSDDDDGVEYLFDNTPRTKKHLTLLPGGKEGAAQSLYTCPNCGSHDVDDDWPHDRNLAICEDCDYSGPRTEFERTNNMEQAQNNLAEWDRTHGVWDQDTHTYKHGARPGEMGTTDRIYECPNCGGRGWKSGPVGARECHVCEGTGIYHPQYDDNPPADARSEDVDTMLQDFGGGVAMTSEKDAANFRGKRGGLSAQEQQELINEQGTARNIGKLNLEGTHYTPEDNELESYFLWDE